MPGSTGDRRMNYRFRNLALIREARVEETAGPKCYCKERICL